MNNKDCSICDQELVSDIGKGCKMCGMPLESKEEDFCSKKCGIDYVMIHKNQINLFPGANK